jgi:hypothetical protein
VEDGGGGGCAAGSRGRLVWTVWLVSTSQNWWVDNCSQGNGKAREGTAELVEQRCGAVEGGEALGAGLLEAF